MINKQTPILLIFALSFTITSCSTTGGSSSYSRTHKGTSKKSSVPKVPPKVMPGGSGDNWRYLGSSDDRLITSEINESSITSGKINKFQDRKTVVDQNKFNYQNLTPKYKYNLSWWRIDCSQKQYLIDSSSIYDVYGNLIKNYSFSGSNWSEISNASIAEQQYNYICKGIGRNIGY
jgi:hypothetical protein